MSLLNSESLSIFKFRDFRLFVLARFILTMGVQMQFGTIYLQIYYEYTKDELTLGKLGLTEALPFIVLCFFSGHVADKFYKKRIILLSTFLLLLGSVFLYLNASQHIRLGREFGMWALFIMTFIFGIVRSFFAATTNPYMSLLVPRQFYMHSATWNSTAWHVGAILGPVLSGIIYGYNGQLNGSWCHLLNILFFAIALLLFVFIKNKGAPEKNQNQENVYDSMRVGVRFVFKNNMVLSAISLDLFAVLFGGVTALIPAFNDKILHMGPEAYGFLRTAPAIGAVFMAGIMIFYPPLKKAGLALIWSVAAFGLFTILFALCKNYWLAFLMLFCTGAFDNVSVVVRHSIIQLMTPDNMRGRVSAINSIFIGSSNEIGAFESGLTAKLMGLIPAIIFGGVMTIGVVAGINRLNPKLKKLNLTEY